MSGFNARWVKQKEGSGCQDSWELTVEHGHLLEIYIQLEGQSDHNSSGLYVGYVELNGRTLVKTDDFVAFADAARDVLERAALALNREAAIYLLAPIKLEGEPR